MIHEEEEKKQTRRGWKILGGLAALLLAYAAVIFFMDDPLEDDSDLIPHFTPGGGPENGLAIFLQEITANPPEDFTKLPMKVRNREPGTEAQLFEYAERQVGPRNAYLKLLASHPEGWRWPAIEKDLSLFRRDADATRCMDTARLQSFTVRSLIHQGKRDEAIKEALALAKFGNELFHSEGAMLHWMVANAIQNIGETTLELALAGTERDKATLMEVQTTLEALDTRYSDLAFAVRVDAVSFRNTMRSLNNGSCDPKIFDLNPWQALTIKPHRTLNAHLSFTKPEINSLDARDWSGLLRAEEKRDEFLRNWDSTELSGIANFNAGGYRMLEQVLELSEGKRILANFAFHRQRIVMLALRRFEQAKGRLPDALTELVPEFMSALPLDPYDNTPVRWNALKQIVYSVGLDLKDDGGEMKKYGTAWEPDIGLRYWWAPPEPESPPAPVVRRPRTGKPASTTVPSAPK